MEEVKVRGEGEKPPKYPSLQMVVALAVPNMHRMSPPG